MTKAIKTFFIIGLLGLIIACSNTDISTNPSPIITENETTENLTNDSEETTDNPSTNDNNQTTIESTTDTSTEIPTTNDTTTETTTEVPTTDSSSTNEPTTEVPTTTETPSTTEVPSTTQTPTTEVTTVQWVTIYFENVSSATSINTLSAIPGNAFTMPDDPIWEGYIFDGWFTDESLTIPFNITVYPDNDMTVYAKWIEEINLDDEIMAALENDYGFVCDNNICTLEEYSWLIYSFNFNDLTFKKELIDDDASDNETKHEVVIIDENWNVSYSFSIQYLSTSTASMTVSGDALTDTYNIDSFSSNPSNYKTESIVYDDAVDFISGAVIFLEIIVDNLEINFDELN